MLRIRQWDDMAEEFGITIDGDIDCLYTFTEPMRKLCGMTFTVESVYETYLEPEEDGFDRWTFSADMLEPIACEEDLSDIAIFPSFDFWEGG